MAVLQAFAGDEPELVFLRLVEQRLRRCGMRGGKRERGGDTVAQQFCYKKNSCLGSIVAGCIAFFFWKGVVLQPRQQTVRGRANHVGLRVVDVHVHKTGGDDAALQVLHRNSRVLGGEGGDQAAVVAHRLYNRPAMCIRADDQQAVFFKNGRL